MYIQSDPKSVYKLAKTKPKISRYSMMRLDWIAILDEAIKARPTSWWGEKTPPVREWRNASDEVCFAVIHAMEKAGLIDKALPEHYGLDFGYLDKPIKE